MQYVMVAIKDHKSDSFTPPSFFRHSGQAIRAFIDSLNNPAQEAQQALMGKYPGDFDLYEIGSYDDNDATIEPIQPKLLYSGSNARAITN